MGVVSEIDAEPCAVLGFMRFCGILEAPIRGLAGPIIDLRAESA